MVRLAKQEESRYKRVRQQQKSTKKTKKQKIAAADTNRIEHDILSLITAMTVFSKHLLDARHMSSFIYLLGLMDPILDFRHFFLVGAIYHPDGLAQKLSTSDKDRIYHSIMSIVTEAIADACLISNSTGSYSEKVEEVLDDLREQLREPVLRCQRYFTSRRIAGLSSCLRTFPKL